MTPYTHPGALSRRTLLAAAVAAPAFAPSASVAQAAGGRFVFANGSAFDTIDPHLTFDVGRVGARINLYDSLMRWQDNPPKLAPWLAERFEVSDGGRRYTFTLRQGVKFHDGSELAAADVVYSMERILALKQGAYALFQPLVQPGSTQAADRYTVVFNLSEPSAIFMASTHDLYVVNSALVRANEKDGDWGREWLARNEAGSGSFALSRYDAARGFLARRFDQHFMGPATLAEIDYRYVAEANSRVLGLLRGDFHGTDSYLPQDQIRRLAADANMQVLEAESTRPFYAAIHTSRAPMTDINFRKALAYAFDYDGWITNILGGAVSRNVSIIPNPMWGALRNDSTYAFDLERAKYHLSLVKEPLREITIAGMVGYEQTAQAGALLQNGLAKIGVQAKLVNEPWPVVAAKGRDEGSQYDVLFQWRSTLYADPHNFAELYDSRRIGRGNISFYRNPRVDALLDQALATPDQAVREPLYQEFCRLLIEDAAGVFIHNTKWFGPFRKNVQGVRFCPIGDGQEWRWISLA